MFLERRIKKQPGQFLVGQVQLQQVTRQGIQQLLDIIDLIECLGQIPEVDLIGQ